MKYKIWKIKRFFKRVWLLYKFGMPQDQDDKTLIFCVNHFEMLSIATLHERSYANAINLNELPKLGGAYYLCRSSMFYTDEVAQDLIKKEGYKVVQAGDIIKIFSHKFSESYCQYRLKIRS